MPKKFYITTSIAYTNSTPHLGFALELIQADVIARYNRLLRKDVFFLTGTDEHGQKVAKAAEDKRKTPAEFCDEISGKFKDLKRILNLSFDDFIRTTDKKRHWPSVEKIWKALEKSGDIYKKEYQGLYCSGCEAFITKKDLINGKCPIHQKEPEIIKERNYFFRLSRYSEKIAKIIKSGKIKIIPKSKKKEILNFIQNGLKDISFSRPVEKLKWGIPVPGDNSQVIYVWADALSNYLSAIGYDNPEYKKYWPADIQFIGKDILKFHAAIWPGMLLSLKLSLPKTIFVHGFITVASQKMSKSLGNVIDPFELVEKYGTDAVRYFLLREIPPNEDGDFTYDKFEKRYNADLAGGLGNLVARIITLAKKLKTKNGKRKTITKNLKLKKEIDKIKKNYKKALSEFKFNEALILIWNLISFCDKYIEKEKPWELLKLKEKENALPAGRQEKLKTTINDLLFALNEIAKLLQLFLPETAEKILNQLKTQNPEPLFPRLTSPQKPA